jgi:hypothetical protein
MVVVLFYMSRGAARSGRHQKMRSSGRLTGLVCLAIIKSIVRTSKTQLQQNIVFADEV